MNRLRRNFLTQIATSIAGLLIPQTLLAVWPKASFSITRFEDSLQNITNNRQIIEGEVSLKVPAIAENGTQVRTEVSTELSDVTAINLLVDKNPVPLTSRFLVLENNIPYVAVNLKIRETSNVVALVETKDKVYRMSKEVRVIAGGCD